MNLRTICSKLGEHPKLTILLDWETELFLFLKGAFQGDPSSGIIFLIGFNPLIEYIKQFKQTQGYTINETHVVTKPFADDFNIISHNKNLPQQIITDVFKKAKTMGLWFKPSKCWSLSISSGKPKDVTFVLKDPEDTTNTTHHIESVHK